ncbi:MAG TPA: AAA family ATPase [Candidatus Nanoarchaeia archaeon]|nr:AAA family ATPase [Candidatus Nanoarchaeia archaeon]
MSLFKDILAHNESLFLDTLALDLEYVPQIVPYRESQQKYIAECIKPLFNNRNGRNLFIHGPSGIGKTVAVKHIFNELNKETDDIATIYINCWKKDTEYKILKDICEQINFKFITNKSSDELFEDVKKLLNRTSVVICFDEIDKIQSNEIIYSFLEDILRKTIIFISNDNKWLLDLDSRIKSRLSLEMLEFKPYNYEETKGILNHRIDLAFVPNVFEKDTLKLVIDKTFEANDIRSGIFLLKQSGDIAESKSSKKITQGHIAEAISKLSSFNFNKSSDLIDEDKVILDLIKENSGNSITEIYDLYKGKGDKSYRTFQRKIEKLKKNKLVTTEEISEGIRGKSTKVYYSKKLSEF